MQGIQLRFVHNLIYPQIFYNFHLSVYFNNPWEQENISLLLAKVNLIKKKLFAKQSTSQNILHYIVKRNKIEVVTKNTNRSITFPSIDISSNSKNIDHSGHICC